MIDRQDSQTREKRVTEGHRGKVTEGEDPNVEIGGAVEGGA